MRTVLIFGAVVLGLVGVTLRAQLAAPVYVAFRFDAETAVRGFKPEALEAAEREVGGRIAALCQRKLAWWMFEVAKNATQVPRLDVWLVEGAEWQIGMSFASDAVAPATDLWSGVLFKPGDFAQQASTLRSEGWGPAIERQFERELLRRHAGALLKTLQLEAPLGRAVKLPDAAGASATSAVILPLAWERYKTLSASLFIIRCRSDAGPVMLHSAGIEEPAKFTPQTPPFDGIAVQLSKWEDLNGQQVPIADRLDRLSRLMPVAFFLKEHRKTWAVAEQPR